MRFHIVCLVNHSFPGFFIVCVWPFESRSRRLPAGKGPLDWLTEEKLFTKDAARAFSNAGRPNCFTARLCRRRFICFVLLVFFSLSPFFVFSKSFQLQLSRQGSAEDVD